MLLAFVQLLEKHENPRPRIKNKQQVVVRKVVFNFS